MQGSHPGYDANGTANREILNGYLNSGPAAWSPWTTNTSVTLSNIPFAKYDVIIYFNSDTSGRHGSIDNGSTTFYFSTAGSAAINGVNAMLQPTTSTNSASFPTADFAFFGGMTASSATFTEMPKSGNDQWLGIAAFQLVERSNNYVVYGPSPATQIVPVGQPASFSVIAGGLNPAYQWRHAGTNLLNATNATCAIATTKAGQDGNYDVIIANSYGSVTSVVSTLTFYTPKTVEWAGTGSTWDTNSLNWTLNGGTSTTNYTETDNVRFGPLGSAQSSVSLVAATYTPGSITISNAAYTLVSGNLAGSGALRVRNNGSLILDLPDTRTGPTIIDNGSILQLDNGDTAGSLGSGALTNNGGLVFYAGGDEAYGYPIYGTGSITNQSTSGTITLGNNLQGNYLVQSGGGYLLLQGSNTLTGGLVVSSGTVEARSLGALGNAPIVVSGGELQLIYSIDFVAPSLTLAGGVLHGVGGYGTFEGLVVLTNDSTINVDSGARLTLNNATGIAGAGYNLTLGSAGTLVLAGTNNAWSSVTINSGTLQIGNGTNGSLAGGLVTVSGTLAFDTSVNLLVTNSIGGSGLINQLGGGIITVTGDLSSFSGTTTVSNGGFGGITTMAGPVSVLPGATLAPGTPSDIGTLTVNSDLTLGGNVLAKVNKSLAQSNDLVTVSGALANTNNGTVTVTNLGSALKTGDRFVLFSQAVTGGDTLTVTGGGVVWTNYLATDGSIVVVSTNTVVLYTTNLSCHVSGGNLSLTWPATHLGWILQYQTNALASGLSTNWIDITSSAAVTSTNLPVSPATPSVYYRLRHP